MYSFARHGFQRDSTFVAYWSTCSSQLLPPGYRGMNPSYGFPSFHAMVSLSFILTLFPVMYDASLEFRLPIVLVVIVQAPLALSCQLCPGILDFDFDPASSARSLSSLLGFLQVSNCGQLSDRIIVYLPCKTRLLVDSSRWLLALFCLTSRPDSSGH